MRRRHTVCTALVTLMCAVAACGTESGPPPAQTQRGGGGFASGECNLVSDQDVDQFAGAGKFTKVLVNDVGCYWQQDTQFGPAADGMGITTWWYRGSDLDGERKLERESGRTVTEVSINGRAGFEAFDEDACSVYVAKGPDVIAWSIQTLDPAQLPDLCSIVRPLAQLSQDRMP